MKVIEGDFGKAQEKETLNQHLHDAIVESGLGDLEEGTYVLFANTDDFYLLTNHQAPADVMLTLQIAQKVLMDQVFIMEAEKDG